MRKAEQNSSSNKRPVLSVAPMIDWTDRHCRYFHRLLSPNALLYSEMISCGAILQGNAERHLAFSAEEHPVALQLGGADPNELAASAKIGANYGYDVINLNCGCPSDRVQKGRFGACLMAEPETVAAGVAAMKAAVDIPVTVKCRIGIDDSDDYPFLEKFVTTVMGAGCDTFIIHARKAWLNGLSPKENREIPPLRYDIAAQIKKTFPHLTVVLNGGLTTAEQVRDALKNFDGVMIGREAYYNPYFLAELEQEFFGTPLPDRFDICEKMVAYAEAHPNDSVHSITRHILGLFHGMRGAKGFRQVLSTDVQTISSAENLMEKALKSVKPL